jgi:hypothetical protein
MNDTTANAGVPAGAMDGKAASSTAATASQPARSGSQRMADTLKASRKGEDGKRSPSSTANPSDGAQPPAADGVQKAGDALPEGDKAAADKVDAEKGKKEPDTVPLKAFKARIGEMNDKVRLRTEERDAATTRESNTAAALKLLAEEFESYKASVKAGKIPDERDEQLRQFQLEQRARDEHQRIARERGEQKTKAGEEERKASIKARVDKAVGDACSKHDLVEPARLKLELATVWKTNPRASVEAVAAKLQEDLVQKVKTRLVPPTPPAPTTVQASANGSAVRFADNAKGMSERLRARRAVGA